MSDPYGNNAGGQSPQGQSPYGGSESGGSYPPPPPGGGAGGYSGGDYGGGGYPAGGFQPAPSTDGVSIAALVTSFLCCFAPVGVILGLVGLSRTKGGQRKGRGLAIAAIPIGIVMTLLVAGGVTWLVIFGKSVLTPDNAKVGQCVNTSLEDDDGVLLRKTDCDDEHDGEIVAVVEVTDSNREDIEQGSLMPCLQEISDDDMAKLRDHSDDIKGQIEDPDDIDNGDVLICYVEPDKKLDKPLL